MFVVLYANGAPPSTHLRTKFDGLRGKDRAFEDLFAAFDANLIVVDLDDIDQRLQVGFAEGYRSRRELLSHAATEALDECGIDLDVGTNLRLDCVQRSFRAIAIGLEAVEPIFEHVIEVGQAILDQLIETLELFFRIAHLPLQGHDAVAHALCLCRATGS
jgi:hypothetical protein